MADWITLIAKRQTAYFASEVEVEVSSMESTKSWWMDCEVPLLWRLAMDNPPLPNSLSYYVQKKTKKNLTKRSFSLPLPRFHAIQKPSTAATKVLSVPMEFK